MLRFEAGRNFAETDVLFRIFTRWRTDDQRSARLVDQDRINLIDDGKIELALAQQISLIHHVIAQIVKPKLVIRPIRDISCVGFLAGTGTEFFHTRISVRFVIVLCIVDK